MSREPFLLIDAFQFQSISRFAKPNFEPVFVSALESRVQGDLALDEVSGQYNFLRIRSDGHEFTLI